MSSSTVTTETLAALVSNALERMAFVFAEPSTVTAGEVLAQATSHACIQLRGEGGLAVTVSATDGMVQEIASSMMGCEPDEIDVEDHGFATVAELANVFGGEIVLRSAQEGTDLTASLPEQLDDEAAGRRIDRAAGAGCTCVVATADGQLLVSVSPQN